MGMLFIDSGGGIGGHRVGGMEWVPVRHEWRQAFTSMSKAAWREDIPSGQEHLRLFEDERTMGVKHITHGWSKTLWTHMWIHHMYAYVAKWGTFARFSCF